MRGCWRIPGAVLAAGAASGIVYVIAALLLGALFPIGPEDAFGFAVFALQPPFFGVLYYILLRKEGERYGKQGCLTIILAFLAGYAAMVAALLVLGMGLELLIGEASNWISGIAGWAAFGYVVYRLWPRQKNERPSSDT